MTSAVKTHSSVAVRLPAHVIAECRAEALADGTPWATILQRRIEQQLEGEPPQVIRRQPTSNERCVFSLRRDLRERLRALSDQHETAIGDLIYSILVAPGSANASLRRSGPAPQVGVAA